MVKMFSSDKPEIAGDYNLPHIDLINHKGEAIDLKFIFIELNLYESIYKNAVTGTLIITDAKNQIGRLEVQGLERIAFKLSSPGTKNVEDMLDASVETGEPFHIYKITDRKQIGPGVMQYTLHFASREFMRNLRTKVSQAYNGRLDIAVRKILQEEDYLDSRRKLKYEKTGNSNKIVIPNLRPFDAINMIANRSLPEKSNTVGYYFYQTVKGFHFRSWDSMVSKQGNAKRPIKQEFYYMPLKFKDEAIENKIEHDFKSVQSYRFLNNFHDVAANTALGTYGHRVTSYDLYAKSIFDGDWNFHEMFDFTIHTDFENNHRDAEKTPIAGGPVDYDNDKNVSDYPEARTSLQSTTQFLHNKEVNAIYGSSHVAESMLRGVQVSKQNQILHGTTLKLVVKGQSYLEPGDLIQFNIRPIDADKTDIEEDYRYSGQYVITKIRHQITSDIYTMVLECAKDSVVNPVVAGEPQYKANKNKGDLEDIYDSSTNIYNRHN
jgi:hypothetical protein